MKPKINMMKLILKLIGAGVHRLDLEHLYISEGYVYFSNSFCVLRIKAELITELSEFIKRLDADKHYVIHRTALRGVKGVFRRLEGRVAIFEEKDKEINTPFSSELSSQQIKTLKEIKLKLAGVEKEVLTEDWIVDGVRLPPELLYDVSKLFQVIESLSFLDVRVKAVKGSVPIVAGKRTEVSEMVGLIACLV